MIKMTLRNIFSLLAISLVSLAFSGCSDDDMDLSVPSGPAIRISTGSSFTRAGSANDVNAENNEEALHRVDLFFYGSSDSEDEAFFVYEVYIDATAQADLKVRIPIEKLGSFSNLTSTTADGYVYALVNLPESVKVDTRNNTVGGESATLENLGKVWVSEPAFVNPGLPDDFVMRGGGDVDVVKEGQLWLAEGWVDLERLASKVRLMAELPEKVYIDLHGNNMEQGVDESDAEWERRRSEATEIWEPAPGDEMKLYFYNMTTAGRIDGNVDFRDLMDYKDVDRRTEYEDIVRKVKPSATDATWHDPRFSYSHEIPYYSYPNSWDASTASEDHKSYVIISMPWKRTYNKADQSSGEIYQVCYYQVPVNAIKSGSIEANRMEPNIYYRIKIRLGTLGNKDYGSPSELQDVSYEAVKWVTANVDVSIKDRRYLVVNQKNWVMNNVETLEIPFSTSHKTIVTGCYVTYFRYNDVWGTEPNAQPTPGSQDARTYDSHNKGEFDAWLRYADSQLQDKGGRAGEGVIQLKDRTDGIINDILYYKKNYFYDEWYDAYRYYVGHEHPITFQPGKISYEAAEAQGDLGDWDDYMRDYRKYELDAVYSCTIDDKRSVINFKHPLIQWEAVRKNGEITHYKPVRNVHEPDLFWDEFSRVEIVIKIRHEDWTNGDGHFEETVYVTQYPGMYITVSHNYNPVNQNQYIKVNGHEPAGSSTQWRFYMIDVLGNYYMSNTNPNMYLIHTTQLNPESRGKYIIGDPRTLYYNNLLAAGTGKPASAEDSPLVDSPANEFPVTSWTSWEWASTLNINSVASYNENLFRAPTASLTPTTRTLSYYYPTDESTGAESKEKFVAPTFRIASSHGRVTINGRIEMRRRCATYQEAGRPAGRWRVPTKAEISYIAQLSADGKIPILFGNTGSKTAFGYYWSANGGLRVNGVGDVEDTRQQEGYLPGVLATRCVYDEWYWNQVDKGEYAPGIPGPLETRFLWGDRIKDNPQKLRRK